MVFLGGDRMTIKRIIIPFLLIILVLTGCEPEEELIPIEPDDLITMEVLDDYMFRDDVQYVDLRNFNAKFQSGYIDTFEHIPFFDYLDYRAFDRGDIYEFSPDQILDAQELEHLFDRDKAIFLFADGCIRSGYLKDVLNHLGYERVYVLGGFYEYQGEHLILGSGYYEFGNQFHSTYTSSETNITYMVSGTIDIGHKITSIRFDILDGDNYTFRGEGYDPVIDYNEELTILESHIITDIVTFNELYDALTDLDHSGYGDILGYSLGFSDDFIALIETLVIN
jgi:rhodanese-related sulfurtransferase